MISCTDNRKDCCTYIDGKINIFLKNSQGENLLNTANYNSDNFKIYFKKNGQKIEINNPLSGHPKGFFIDNSYNPIYMGLYLNIDVNEIIPETYIEWNETDTDTLKVTVVKNGGSTSWNSMWLNGDLIYSSSTPLGVTGREITIVK